MKDKLKTHLIYIVPSLLAIIIIVGVGIKLIFIDSERIYHQALIDSDYFSHKPYIEYNRDFAKLKDLQFKGAFYSKTREPIEEFIYNDYYIFLYRLPVVNNKPLNDIIDTKYVTANVGSGSYHGLINDFTSSAPCNYNIQYKLGRPTIEHNINLTLSGQNIQVLKKTDTSYSYYAKLDNFSISYNKNDTIDFFGTLKPNVQTASLPVQITFRKKNNKVYLFLAIENERKVSTHKNLLTSSEFIK